MGPSKGFIIAAGVVVIGGMIAMFVLYRMYAKATDISWERVTELINQEFPNVEHISTYELAKLMADNQAVTIIDSRAEAEFEVSHLPGASHAETVAEIERLAETGNPIVVYCSVGYRSSRLVSELQRAGFSDVRNLEGSIFAWANEGRKLVKSGGQQAKTVHPYNKRWGKLLREELRH